MLSRHVRWHMSNLFVELHEDATQIYISLPGCLSPRLRELTAVKNGGLGCGMDCKLSVKLIRQSSDEMGMHPPHSRYHQIH